MPKKIRKKISISFDLELGSDFQKQVALGSLMAALDGWRFAIPAYHKNNKIHQFDFSITDYDPSHSPTAP